MAFLKKIIYPLIDGQEEYQKQAFIQGAKTRLV